MKLPSFKRLTTTDFEKQFQGLVEKLGLSINDALNSVFFALNKRLTFQDNIMCTVKDVVVTVDSNGIPVQTASFSLDVKGVPVIGILVLNVTNLENTSSYPASATSLSFTQLDNNIRINKITGLEAGVQYRIKVIAIN